jgi:hypothetical protein
VAGAEIDLIVRTVHCEPDGPFGLAAVEIIDKEGFDFLRHGDRSSGDLAADENRLSLHACAFAINI